MYVSAQVRSPSGQLVVETAEGRRGVPHTLVGEFVFNENAQCSAAESDAASSIVEQARRRPELTVHRAHAAPRRIARRTAAAWGPREPQAVVSETVASFVPMALNRSGSVAKTSQRRPTSTAHAHSHAAMRCALQIHQSASDIGWHTTSRGAAQRFPCLRPRLSDAQPSAEWTYTPARGFLCRLRCSCAFEPMPRMAPPVAAADESRTAVVSAS
jgi:hypothetical protein